MQNLLCLQFDILFFNERHMPIAINIEGKYKNITLGGHNQEKEKKHNNNTGGLDWDINTPNTTPIKQLGLVGLGRRRKAHNLSPLDNTARSDWVIDTDETTPLGNGGRPKSSRRG